jgi:hypothetical protein
MFVTVAYDCYGRFSLVVAHCLGQKRCALFLRVALTEYLGKGERLFTIQSTLNKLVIAEH